MSTLWLRSLDWISRAAPAREWITGRYFGTIENVAVLRPGGLGDLVVLTRAALKLSIDIRQILWVVERRNAPWAEYLNIPHLLYDRPTDFTALLRGRRRFHVVLNSEQFHGLATLFAARLARPGGKLIGFSSNPRADYFDEQIPYNPRALSAFDAFQALFASAAGPLLRQGSFEMTPPQLSEAPAAPGRYRVVVLGGLQSAQRRLGIEDWVRIVSFAQRYRSDSLPVYLLGAPADRAISEKIAVAAGGTTNLVGVLPFPRVIETIRCAGRVFGVDSGLLHVADFFGVPTSAVYFSEEKRTEWPPQTSGSEMLSLADVLRANGM